MKRLILLLSLILSSPFSLNAAEVLAERPDGTATFIQGDLGVFDGVLSADFDANAKASSDFRMTAGITMRHLAASHLGAAGTEDFALKSMRSDDLGMVHIRFDQTINHRRVEGAQMILHVREATGEILSLNGDFFPDSGVLEAANVADRDAIKTALEMTEIKAQVDSDVDLVYVVVDDTVHLAYKVMIRYEDSEGPHADILYSSAEDGRLLALRPTIHSANNRLTYSMNNSTDPGDLPGTLLCANGNTCGGDIAATAAHNGASTTYDYYFTKFGRDSLDDQGMTLVSSVHYGEQLNNAFWNGAQMLYGDGDGIDFIPLSQALDVVAHELTHGVTHFESNLIYARESGALNEAFSDIFGATVEAHADGSVSADTWKLGEDVYTPGVPGDALRYMNNPTLDGYSKDYYPERLYPGYCFPNGNNDQCGVHGNSGIANLAFYLLVSGGSHPRGVTTNVVSPIGLSNAERIFYRAQTTYLTANANFEAARVATVQAASDLFGPKGAEPVKAAWDAVGVLGATNQPPVAAWTYSGGGLDRTLDASSSTDDQGIVSYRWTLPGGEILSGRVVNHFFSRYGSHSVTLTVTDGEGATDTQQRWINLAQPTVAPKQGMWFNPERSGNGIDFYVNGQGNYTLVWYTYTAGGIPTWYISGTGPISRATWSQPLYRVTWNGSSSTSTNVGNVTLTFDDDRSTSWFSWVLNGQPGTERYQYLHGGQGRSGFWYAPSESGWGLFVSDSAGVMVATVAFYESGQPRWVQGTAASTSNANIPMRWFTGLGLCPSCGGNTGPTSQAAGSINLKIASPFSSTGTLSTYIQTPGGTSWTRFNLPISILTTP